jgi:hypothetical protein
VEGFCDGEASDEMYMDPLGFWLNVAVIVLCGLLLVRMSKVRSLDPVERGCVHQQSLTWVGWWQEVMDSIRLLRYARSLVDKDMNEEDEPDKIPSLVSLGTHRSLANARLELMSRWAFPAAGECAFGQARHHLG